MKMAITVPVSKATRISVMTIHLCDVSSTHGSGTSGDGGGGGGMFFI